MQLRKCIKKKRSRSLSGNTQAATWLIAWQRWGEGGGAGEEGKARDDGDNDGGEGGALMTMTTTMTMMGRARDDGDNDVLGNATHALTNV